MTMVAYEGEERPELNLEEEESEETYGRIVAEPLEAGFGITIGNALRRTLLSALPGTAITAVRIEGVEHEFTTVPIMKEDIVEFLLNVKDIRIRSLTRPAGQDVPRGHGRRRRHGRPDPADAPTTRSSTRTCTSRRSKVDDARLSVEFTVEQGRGYVPAGTSDGLAIGVIPVDAIFSPVRRVNYRVEHTRVGQVTNYDRLMLEVWTDGTISASRRCQQGRRDPGRPVRARSRASAGRSRRWSAAVSAPAPRCRRTATTRRSKTSTSRCAPTTASSAAA